MCIDIHGVHNVHNKEESNEKVMKIVYNVFNEVFAGMSEDTCLEIVATTASFGTAMGVCRKYGMTLEDNVHVYGVEGSRTWKIVSPRRSALYIKEHVVIEEVESDITFSASGPVTDCCVWKLMRG